MHRMLAALGRSVSHIHIPSLHRHNWPSKPILAGRVLRMGNGDVLGEEDVVSEGRLGSQAGVALHPHLHLLLHRFCHGCHLRWYVGVRQSGGG